MCQRWQKGLISNAEYLHFLNFAANRSFNDSTQYPVFPWVLADFKSDQIPEEPTSKSTKQVQKAWRDLSKPVGALSSEKLEQFKSKYFEILQKSPNSSPFLQPHQLNAPSLGSDSDKKLDDLDEVDNTEQAYMYMSHYSTPGIVFYYLIRRFPSYMIRIQNDDFGGPPDRIFFDVFMSW